MAPTANAPGATIIIPTRTVAASFKPIEVRTLADRVYDIVRDRILSGDMAGGEPIRQDAIAGELGISKIPLREALTRLEQFGLVTSYANRGYVVSSLSAEEAEEVFALRLKLEPDAMVRGSPKLVPLPSSLSTLMRPPCASTIPLTIANPSPMPRRSPESPCQKRSNKCGIPSAGIPGPVS